MEIRNEMEIDILGLLLHLRTKIWIILAATLVFGLGGFIGSKMISTPVYKATTQVYVYQQNADKGMDSGNLTVATQVRRDCQVIMKGESVTKAVIEKLGLRTTPSALSSAITISTEDNTRILNLSYTGADPEQAALIINTVCEVSAAQIKELMGMDVVKVIYEADIPTAQSTVNIRRNALVWAIIGAVLTVTVLIVVFLLDDTIRSEDDVEKYLDLSTLAAIPVSNELFVKRGTRKSGNRKKSKKSQARG